MTEHSYCHLTHQYMTQSQCATHMCHQCTASWLDALCERQWKYRSEVHFLMHYSAFWCSKSLHTLKTSHSSRPHRRDGSALCQQYILSCRPCRNRAGTRLLFIDRNMILFENFDSFYSVCLFGRMLPSSRRHLTYAIATCEACSLYTKYLLGKHSKNLEFSYDHVCSMKVGWLLCRWNTCRSFSSAGTWIFLWSGVTFWFEWFDFVWNLHKTCVCVVSLDATCNLNWISWCKRQWRAYQIESQRMLLSKHPSCAK